MRRALRRTMQRVWSGLVTLDAEGFVVWYARYDGDLGSASLTISPFEHLGAADDYAVAYGVWFGGSAGFPTSAPHLVEVPLPVGATVARSSPPAHAPTGRSLALIAAAAPS